MYFGLPEYRIWLKEEREERILILTENTLEFLNFAIINQIN